MFKSLLGLSVAATTCLGPTGASATSDNLMSIRLPVENLHEEGFCEGDTLAWDAVATTFWSGAALIGRVLSNEHRVQILIGGEDPYSPKSYNINPIADGEDFISIRFDHESVTDNWCTPRIHISVEPNGNAAASQSDHLELNTRLKLALLFTLRNVFAHTQDARVNVTMSALPDQEIVPGVRLYPSTRYPYTERSPHYLALIDDLASSAPCNVGKAISAHIKKAPHVYRCPSR